MTATITATDRPIAANTAPSNAVVLLKCDGTPRHRCMVTSPTSTIVARLSAHSSTDRPRRDSRTFVET